MMFFNYFAIYLSKRGMFFNWSIHVKNIPIQSDFFAGTDAISDCFCAGTADQYKPILKENSATRLSIFGNINDHALFFELGNVVLIVDRVQSEDTADLVRVKISTLEQANHFHSYKISFQIITQEAAGKPS